MTTFLAHMGDSTGIPQAKIVVRLENLRVADVVKSDWNGSVLTKMRILHSVSTLTGREGSKLSFPRSATSPFLVSGTYEPPLSGVCIYHFLSLRSQMIAPFRATLSGMVANVQAAELSQSGNPKKYFDLVDETGSWLQCCALGRNAGTHALEDDNEVVIYFGNARPSLGSADAMMLAMKDAVIVKIGRRNPPTPKRTYIDITAPRA